MQPRNTETYTFRFYGTGSMRLWVNGVKLVDGKTENAKEFSGTIDLQAGQLYDIRMEDCQSDAQMAAVLLWSSPSIKMEYIPVECLFAAPIAGKPSPKP